MYSLILSSKLPNAKKFKHWVTSEVLPAIRKNGSYQLPQTPEERLKLAMEATIHLDERMTNVEKDVDFIKITSEDSFVISRYEDLSKKDFDRAINFISNWYPSYPLQQDIQRMNAQTDLGL